MTYSVRPMSNERWGIYAQDRLLATYGCQYTCYIVLELLKERTKTGFPIYKHPASLTKQAA